MLENINPIVEMQYLFYFIPFILGLEIAAYSFYQYFKNKDTLLKLDRILLSFGTFSLLLISGAFILVIVRILNFNPAVNELLSKVGFSVVMIGPIGFMGFILIEEFSKIINLKLGKILSGLNLIPVIMAWIFSTDSIVFFISIIFMVLNSLYAVYIQLRLIFISLGNIRKRFIQFFSGEVLALIALVFAAQTNFGILPIPTLVTFYLGVAILTTGLITIFLAITNFPPFYEFEWKEGLSQFLVINPLDNTLLFFYDFSDPYREEFKKKDKKYLIGGLKGLNEIIDTITASESKNLNSIKFGEHFILQSQSKNQNLPLQYALIVDRDLNSYRHILRELQEQFEAFFKEILSHFEDLNTKQEQEQIFLSFDVIINSLMEN